MNPASSKSLVFCSELCPCQKTKDVTGYATVRSREGRRFDIPSSCRGLPPCRTVVPNYLTFSSPMIGTKVVGGKRDELSDKTKDT